MNTISTKTFLLIIIISSFHHLHSNSQSLSTKNFKPTEERSFTVKNHCTSNIYRQKLYLDYGLEAQIKNAASVTNTFKLNTSFIAAAAGGDWNAFGQTLRDSAGKFFVFTGAWVIGLAVAIFLFPFLLCCCLCPWSCPLWSRKSENMPYTRCELIWPGIVSIILLLLILVTSIVGISSPFKAQRNYDETACASGIVIDDTLNGNVRLTDEEDYFVGIGTMNKRLVDMNSKINTLNSEIAKLGTTSPGVIDTKTKIAAAKTSTAQVPSLTQSSLTLTYSTPLENTPGTTTSTINSIFPDVLGNKLLTSNTLVGVSYLSLTTYQSVVDQVSTGADTFTSNVPQYTLQVQKAINQTNRYSTELSNQDKKIDDFFSKNEGIFKGITTGQYVFYGLLIGFAAVMIIAVTCTIWRMSSGCRKFMNLICVLLYLLCIIAFLFCIFISIINPIIYYTCEYAQENINSKSTLKATLVDKFSVDAAIAGNISECIAVDSDGDIVENILGDKVYQSIQSLNNTYTSLTNIDISSINLVTLSHSSMLDNILAFKSAKIVDITDQSSLFQLLKLSQASNYACSSNGFTSDSWIPSISQNPVYIPCQVNGAPSTNSTTCTSNSNFNSRASGCTGCMDTSDLFKANNTYLDVRAALTTRYADTSCNPFNTELSNVWGNFYKKKLDVIGPVESRANTALTNSITVVNTVNYFTTVKSNIDSNFSSIVDAQNGLLNGLNCLTIGEDVRLMKNVVCGGLFMYTYFTRVIFGILSLALLFLMCFVTCTSHRNFKQIQFEQYKYNDQYPKQEKEMNQYNINTQQNLQNINSNQYEQKAEYFKNPVYI